MWLAFGVILIVTVFSGFAAFKDYKPKPEVATDPIKIQINECNKLLKQLGKAFSDALNHNRGCGCYCYDKGLSPGTCGSNCRSTVVSDAVKDKIDAVNAKLAELISLFFEGPIDELCKEIAVLKKAVNEVNKK